MEIRRTCPDELFVLRFPGDQRVEQRWVVAEVQGVAGTAREWKKMLTAKCCRCRSVDSQIVLDASCLF
jgi:hypothetical protein